MLEGSSVAGFWTSAGNRVVIADGEMYHGSTVRHEMLHALLTRAGHPREEFLGSCAALVNCSDQCQRDAGPLKLPAEYVELPPDSLSVTATVELMPRESDGERWLTLWVMATNPHDKAVLVAPPTSARTPATFGYYLIGPQGIFSGGEVATDSSMLFFAPQEAKRWLFEFRVDTQVTEYTITQGQYAIAGYYAHHFSTFDTLEVSP